MRTQTTFIPANTDVAAALRARRARILETWTASSCGLGSGAAVVPAGVPISVLGTDDVYRFRAHDDHVWLTGTALPTSVVVCDPHAGAGDDAFTLFVHLADTEDRVWHGPGVTLDEVAEQSALARVRPLDDLEGVLASLRDRSIALFGNVDLLEHPSAYHVAPSILEPLRFDAELSGRVEQATHAARRVKDDVEVAFMRAAAHATAAGHRAAMELARVGMTERELQIELEATFLRAGGDQVAYGSIVASGPNAAVLHAAPSSRALEDGDLVLIDAGAEVAKYDCDVTRTFPVSGAFTSEQRAVYDIVLGVQRRAIDDARAGTEYRELHLAACRGVAAGLVELGLMRGNPDELVARDAHALFFPHGLGHLIGLSTHDVGGYEKGRERSDRFGLKYLRADLPLEAGHVVTIEPGIYFIDALIHDEVLRVEYADVIDFERAESFLTMGGVRIEDTVHVTDGDAEVLTADAPKAPDAVEALC